MPLLATDPVVVVGAVVVVEAPLRGEPVVVVVGTDAVVAGPAVLVVCDEEVDVVVEGGSVVGDSVVRVLWVEVTAGTAGT